MNIEAYWVLMPKMPSLLLLASWPTDKGPGGERGWGPRSAESQREVLAQAVHTCRWAWAAAVLQPGLSSQPVLRLWLPPLLHPPEAPHFGR